jgi:hypothetical protein
MRDTPAPAATRTVVLTAPNDGPASGADAGSRESSEKIDAIVRELLAQTYGAEEWRPEIADDFAAFRKYVFEGLKRLNRRRFR